MQDMTFDANELNYDGIHFNDDGSLEYYFDRHGHYFDLNRYKFPFKHFLNDNLSCKYKNGVNKVFFKSEKKGYISFMIYVYQEDEEDEDEEARFKLEFDVWLKYNEKEKIYQVTLFDIFMLIDFTVGKTGGFSNNNVNIINLIPNENKFITDSLGNFEIVTDIKYYIII
jgi:hypothetical protein